MKTLSLISLGFIQTLVLGSSIALASTDVTSLANGSLTDGTRVISTKWSATEPAIGLAKKTKTVDPVRLTKRTKTVDPVRLTKRTKTVDPVRLAKRTKTVDPELTLARLGNGDEPVQTA